MIEVSSFFSSMFYSQDLCEVLRMPDIADYCVYVVCTCGRLSVYVNGRLYEMCAHDLLHWQFEDIVVLDVISDDFVCYAILVHRTEHLHLLDRTLRTESTLQTKILYSKNYPLMHLSPVMEQPVQYYTRLLRSLSAMPDNHYRRSIADMAYLMIYYNLNWWAEQQIQHLRNNHTEETGAEFAASQSGYLLYRFIRLLSDNGGRKRSVEWYASELHITPKYLNKICTEMQGQSPVAQISAYAVAEIKKLLADRLLSLQDIAVCLQFSSSNSLCKYFRCHTGMSPTEYRKTLYRKD